MVTTLTSDGVPVGFTANSFTSVSLDPPLLLVCPGKHLQSYTVFEQSGCFAVNILSDSQEDVSNLFAGSFDDRFEQVDWSADAHGSPILSGCLASFSCRVHERHLAGDHMILVGEVAEFQYKADQSVSGLGYCNKGYFSLRREQQANAAVGSEFNGVVGAIIENNGRILMGPAGESLCIPSVTHKGGSGARDALLIHLQSKGLNIKLGPVYSVYEDSKTNSHVTIFRASVSTQDTAGYGSFVPIADLNTMEYPDTAQASMMQRYALETMNRSFGLYIGDAQSGDIHPALDQSE